MHREEGIPMSKIDIGKIEELILKIQGVISTKIVASEDGQVEELHLLTDNTRNPKQISRDVQSACAAELNLDIDHKVISIAQINFSKDNFLKNRVKILGVTKRIQHDEIFCDVVLAHNGDETTGHIQQKNISSRRDHAVVQATIKALEALFHFDDRIFIEDIEIIERNAYAVAVVVVSTFFTGEELLSGSSVITDDRHMALVRATLDAVNRRLNVL